MSFLGASPPTILRALPWEGDRSLVPSQSEWRLPGPRSANPWSGDVVRDQDAVPKAATRKPGPPAWGRMEHHLSFAALEGKSGPVWVFLDRAAFTLAFGPPGPSGGPKRCASARGKRRPRFTAGDASSSLLACQARSGSKMPPVERSQKADLGDKSPTVATAATEPFRAAFSSY